MFSMKKITFALFSFFIFCTSAAYVKEQSHFFFSPETIFSYIKDYSSDDQEEILKDLEAIKNICAPLQNKGPLQRPLYLATAGAPGTKKSTILESFMKRYVLESHMTYLDPDQRALKFMSRTYYAKSLSTLSISEREDYLQSIQCAYEKWRGASNYITFTLLEDALLKRQNIAHGTTSTAEHVPAFFSTLKKAGYEISLLLCSAKESLKEDAIEYRNREQRFYQLTPEDAASKGKIFPKQMQEYFTFADSLYLFWSDSLFDKERLAAKLINGKLKIYDRNSYDRFVSQFEKDKDRDAPSWNDLLKTYQTRF